MINDADDSQTSSDEESKFALDKQNLERILTINSQLSFETIQEILSSILKREGSIEDDKKNDDDDGEEEDKFEIKETESDKDNDNSPKKKRMKTSNPIDSYHLRKGQK